MAYPATLDDLDATRGSASDTLANPDHSTHHSNEDAIIEALQTKVGADSSAVTSSHDYKLGSVADGDKASSLTGTETLTNKTLSSPTINTPSGLVKGDVGLGNVDNVADANQTALGTVTTGNADAIVTNSSKIAKGKVELATTAEIDTGTDSTRAIPVDQYVASDRNVRYVDWRVLDKGTAQLVITNVAGDFEFPFTGTVVSIGAYVDTAGTTGTATYDVNLAGTTIMTTNKITIDTGEKSSRTAATAPALTTTAITAGDILTADVDAIHTTPASGLVIRIGVRQT